MRWVLLPLLLLLSACVDRGVRLGATVTGKITKPPYSYVTMCGKVPITHHVPRRYFLTLDVDYEKVEVPVRETVRVSKAVYDSTEINSDY